MNSLYSPSPTSWIIYRENKTYLYQVFHTTESCWLNFNRVVLSAHTQWLDCSRNHIGVLIDPRSYTLHELFQKRKVSCFHFHKPFLIFFLLRFFFKWRYDYQRYRFSETREMRREHIFQLSHTRLKKENQIWISSILWNLAEISDVALNGWEEISQHLFCCKWVFYKSREHL